MAPVTAKSLFGTLANSIRLDILLSLRKGEKNVSELVRDLGVKQSTASHNLRRLMAAGLVSSRRDGPFHYFALNAVSMDPVLDLMEKHASLTGEKMRLALRQTEDRLNAVVDSAPIILFALDKDGVFTLLRGKALEKLGMVQGQLVGQCIYPLLEERHPHLRENIDRVLRGEEFTTIDVVNGGDFIYETRYTPVRDARGEVTGVVGVATDITGRVKTEESLKEARAELDRLKGEAVPAPGTR
jgi:PAS domain S-box-containing protein